MWSCLSFLSENRVSKASADLLIVLTDRVEAEALLIILSQELGSVGWIGLTAWVIFFGLPVEV
jgi:hypothetical protein